MKFISPRFAAFRASYPARSPDLSALRSADELRDIGSEDEVLELTDAPLQGVPNGLPPDRPRGQHEAMHIWVVARESVPLALEESPLGKTIEGRGRLAHTNLTGGGEAHCGGELWLIDEGALAITGGSGRYPPRSAAELTEIVATLRHAGYRVACAGWSEEINGPARHFRGGLLWQQPLS